MRWVVFLDQALLQGLGMLQVTEPAVICSVRSLRGPQHLRRLSRVPPVQGSLAYGHLGQFLQRLALAGGRR